MYIFQDGTEQKIEFQLIPPRFAVERFLYRLSQSKYSNDFVLKGAMVFQVWAGEMHRPTRDLDLLSFGEPDIAYFTTTIRELCTSGTNLFSKMSELKATTSSRF